MRLVRLMNEGEQCPWYMGYVRKRVDYLATEVAIYPLNFLLQFFYWFRVVTYYRHKYERELTELASREYRRGYKAAKGYYLRKGKEEAYSEIRGALGRGWALTGTGLGRLHEDGRIEELNSHLKVTLRHNNGKD